MTYHFAPMGLLAERRAIVTGAADGIGAAVARLFANAGAKVLAVDIQGDRLRGNLCDENIRLLEQDVAAPDAGYRISRAAMEQLGGIDILVNNAAIAGSYSKICDVSDDEWRSIQSVNIDAIFRLCKAATEALAASGRGKIINTSSVLDRRGVPNLVAYSASKGAVSGFTRALAVELGPRGIYVNAVLPGLIVNTGLSRSAPESSRAADRLLSRVPLGRVGSPEDIAPVYLFLASSLSDWINGQLITADGGLTALL